MHATSGRICSTRSSCCAPNVGVVTRHLVENLPGDLTHPLPAHAVGEVAGQILDQMAGDDPDVIVLFVSPHFIGALDDTLHALQSLLTPRVLVGTTAGGVIGGTHEAEDGVGFAAFA